MAPSELKNMWISSVRRICHTDRYYVSRKWDKIFAEVSAWLDANPEISPLRFVEAQIHWCLGNRVRGALWPNLLSGPAAVQRYHDAPDETEIVNDLSARYQAQGKAFVELSNAVGLHDALQDTMVTWSPLYLAYVRFCSGLPIPEDLYDRARQEAQAESLIDRVFPADFLRSLS